MSIKEMMGILIRFCKGNEFSDNLQIVVRNMSVIFLCNSVLDVSFLIKRRVVLLKTTAHFL